MYSCIGVRVIPRALVDPLLDEGHGKESGRAVASRILEIIEVLVCIDGAFHLLSTVLGWCAPPYM